MKNVGKKKWLTKVGEAALDSMIVVEREGIDLAGFEKRSIVKGLIKNALAKIDIPLIPDWIERHLKDAVVDSLIEILYTALTTDRATRAFSAKRREKTIDLKSLGE